MELQTLQEALKVEIQVHQVGNLEINFIYCIFIILFGIEI